MGKEYVKAYVVTLLISLNMQSTLCGMPGWINHKLEIKTAGRNINNLRYAGDSTLMAETKEELKSLLMKVREESEKAGFKLNTQKVKVMAFGLITLWPVDGEKMKTVRDFIFLGCKITADGDCNHQLERHLLLGRKAMTNLDSTLTSRHYFATKVHIVKYGFSSSHVWM